MVSRFDSLYDTIYRIVIENCQEFRSCALEISPFTTGVLRNRGHDILTLARRFRAINMSL